MWEIKSNSVGNGSAWLHRSDAVFGLIHEYRLVGDQAGWDYRHPQGNGRDDLVAVNGHQHLGHAVDWNRVLGPPAMVEHCVLRDEVWWSCSRGEVGSTMWL